MFPLPYEHLEDAVVSRLVLLGNHILASEPVATTRLRPHAGRCLRLRWVDWPGLLPVPPTLSFWITPAGLLERRPEVSAEGAMSGSDAPVDLDISVPAGNPVALLARGLIGKRPAVSISGDSTLAADVNWVIDNLHWDVRDDLARLLGELPARELARHATSIAAGFRSAVEGLVQRAKTVRDGAGSDGGFSAGAPGSSPAQRPAR